MAKKTILYEVQLRNGHGQVTEYHVGQTKGHLKKELETESVKVIGIKSLGQKEVIVQPDTDLETEFNVVVDENNDFTFDKHTQGYQFLKNKFQPQVDELEKEIDDLRGE
jgi:hypothetical protein